jgi:hypothetical protein
MMSPSIDCRLVFYRVVQLKIKYQNDYMKNKIRIWVGSRQNS